MADDIKFETMPPRLFTKKAIVAINLHGILGLIPVLTVLFSIPFIFRLFSPKVALCFSFLALGLAVVITVYFNSIAMGNPYARGLICRLNLSGRNGFITQLTFIPRLKSGFWAFMEDADDIGLLSFEERMLVFNGDCTTFSIPFSRIKNLRRKNIGWRGCWIYGNRIVIDFSESTGNRTLEFTERFSLSLPGSMRISKELFNKLSAKIQK